MTKIGDIEFALRVFENAAQKHAKATEQGDYKSGNKYHAEITDAVGYLRKHNEATRLRCFLEHSSVGVRMWSAVYLLKICENDALKALQIISNGPGIHSLTAKTTISEWNKGNLNL